MLVHVALLYVVNNSGVSRNSYGGGAKSESLFFFASQFFKGAQLRK